MPTIQPTTIRRADIRFKIARIFRCCCCFFSVGLLMNKILSQHIIYARSQHKYVRIVHFLPKYALFVSERWNRMKDINKKPLCSNDINLSSCIIYTAKKDKGISCFHNDKNQKYSLGSTGPNAIFNIFNIAYYFFLFLL